MGCLWKYGAHVNKVIGYCSSTVSLLSGLVATGHAPLAIARHMFCIKVDATMRFGRWLWASTPDVLNLLDARYEIWALQLMGADPWRNGHMCSHELGWELTGAARAVYDIATRRAHFWEHAFDTLAGRTFTDMHTSEGDTWARRTHALLEEWGVLDWPVWLSTAHVCTYKTYVKQTLAAVSLTVRRPHLLRHTRPFPYFDIAPVPATALNDALRAKCSWQTLLGHRSLCRLRCGLIMLGHVNQRASSAHVQYCVFCDKRYTSVFAHVACSCPIFAAHRMELKRAGVDCDLLDLWLAKPGANGFAQIVNFAKDIDVQACAFWNKN